MALIDNFAEVLATWGVSAAAGAGLAVLSLKTWISEKIKSQIKSEYDEKLETHKAQLKSQSDVEIEKLKSQLSIVAAERQVRFANLHDKRAEVVAEVYAALNEFLVAVLEYTAIFEPIGIPPREERGKKAADAGNTFVMAYRGGKIFIPRQTTIKLDKIRDEVRGAFIQFQFGVDLASRSGQPTTEKWMDIVNKLKNIMETALDELEDDFRKLLGDDGQQDISRAN